MAKTEAKSNLTLALELMSGFSDKMTEIIPGFNSNYITGQMENLVKHVGRNIQKVKIIAGDVPNIKKDLTQLDFDFTEAEKEDEGGE